MDNKYYEGRIYSFRKFQKILDAMISNLSVYKKSKKISPITKKFEEEIMLSVTSVNKCAMCSYFHAKKSIEKGIDKEDVKQLLNGEFENVEKEKHMALLFAKHYADMEGKVDNKLIDKLKEKYGNEKTEVILGTIRIIMMGNAYGNAFSGLISRFKGIPPRNSSIGRELSVIFGVVIIMPYLFIRNFFRKLF